MAIDFLKSNIHPITGFKYTNTIPKTVPKKIQVTGIDLSKYINSVESVDVYNYKKKHFVAYCKQNEIHDYFVFFNQKRFYEISILEHFINTTIDEPDTKKKVEPIPDGFVIFSRLINEKKAIYSTINSRIIKHKVPKKTIRNVIYVLESEALKHFY